MSSCNCTGQCRKTGSCSSGVSYTPQIKELSDEEINQCWEDLIGTDDYTRIDIGRAIEAKVRGQ